MIRAYFQQIMPRDHSMKSRRESRTRNRVSHTHDQSISRLVNLTERRFHRIVKARYLVTNQAAFHLFALKTLMARSASPCPRNWAPEGLTVAKVNSMPVSLSQIVLADPEGRSERWKGCEFPEHVVVPEKFSLLPPREFPFSLLTVHLPDHNSKYFAKWCLPQCIRWLKHHSKMDFLIF